MNANKMNANKMKLIIEDDSDDEKYCCSCGKYDIWYNLGDADTPMCKCNPDFEGSDEDEDEDEAEEAQEDEEEDISEAEEEEEDPKTKPCSCGCIVIGGSCDKGLAIDNDEDYWEEESEDEDNVTLTKEQYENALGEAYRQGRKDGKEEEEVYIKGIVCKKCNTELPTMLMSEHLDINNPKNKECKCFGDEEEDLYDNFVIQEWDNKDDGFSYIDKNLDEDEILHDKMNNEICLNYENFNAKRSCMWVDEVKLRSKWVRGETIYGDSREKHYTYSIWWSRDKKKIGYYSWILEADGYVSFSLRNGYTLNETDNTKSRNFIRIECLYNDKNLDEENQKK
jgi:hypothetical protein